jgi:hypothetical protein
MRQMTHTTRTTCGHVVTFRQMLAWSALESDAVVFYADEVVAKAGDWASRLEKVWTAAGVGLERREPRSRVLRGQRGEVMQKSRLERKQE